MTIQQEIQGYRDEAAKHKSAWLANKDKPDRESIKSARDAAEKLEWTTNKIAMLDRMSKSVSGKCYHGHNVKDCPTCNGN